MAINRFPLWKNLLVCLVVAVAFLYALPNLYGTDPAIQITATETGSIPTNTTLDQITSALAREKIQVTRTEWQPRGLLLRFSTTDAQFHAREIIARILDGHYLVALNLAPSTPAWLEATGAKPMRLGLDLRGGLHLLFQVNTSAVTGQQTASDVINVGQALRTERIRYAGLSRPGPSTIHIQFHTTAAMAAARSLLNRQFSGFVWTEQKPREGLANNKDNDTGLFVLQGLLAQGAFQQSRQQTLEQAMNTLRNRVNELGVSEATVQQQGASRIAIDLPGIQDTAEAMNILGKTATLEFHLVDESAAGADVTSPPPGSSTYAFANGAKINLYDDVVLRGSSITSAMASTSEDGRPAVNIRLGGIGDMHFSKTTAANIGRRMAIVYIEVKSDITTEHGKKVIHYTTERHVISAPVIQSALANSFQITGLSSPEEARTLALLLRAGALPVPVTLIESREVGPNLGKQNIQKGILSVEVGFILVVLFMAMYYRGLGLIADLALAANLVLIVAILSLLGATLTLPGIAGIVLTMGMAVDANVLIFERIREELRNGAGVQSSIHAGYDRAFMTIVDANVTTLIVAIVLFSLGSGTVKNFAVTLTIGLLTSMFTAITGTRAIVNLLYGSKRALKKISIGI